MMKRYRSTSLISINDMKKIGVDADFLMSFKGVLIMKQEQTLGSFIIDLNSCCREGTVIESIKSAGFLPFLSLVTREDPLISKALTGLVLLSDSTLFIAK